MVRLTELIGCHHSQNGFTLEKMADADAFDRELADEISLLIPRGDDGRRELEVDSVVTWGRLVT